MTSIGAELRSERLRKGLRLDQIASETKIRIHLLEAMEDDHFNLLPNGLLARSFLRQYAHTLGLNEGEIIASFKEQSDQLPEPLPEPLPESRPWHLPHIPELLWVLAAIFACSGAYRLWQDRQRPPAETVIRAVGPRPVSKADVSPSARDDPPKTKLRSQVVSDRRTILALPMEAQPSEPRPVQDSDAQEIHVAFTATEPVWLSIMSDGTQAYRGTLEGQQSKEFGASSKMTVLIGNAGGLEVSLNGRPVGPIGGRGEVQFLLLTPKGAYLVPRTPSVE